MRTRNLILLLFIASSFSLSAQKYKVDTVYYDRTGEIMQGDVSGFTTFEIRAVDKKGRIQGSSIRYTKTGRAVESTDYIKGEKNGEYERYNPLGNVMISGVYEKNKKVGAWATMDMKGDIIQVTDYGVKGDKEQTFDTFSWAEDMIDLPDSLANKAVFFSVEEKSTFPGGPKKWSEFLVSNLRYPVEAKRYGHQGNVFFRFTVLKNGLVVNPVIAKSPHPSLSKEALRIIRMSPNWEPALKDGKPVDSQVEMRLVFRLK